MKPFTLRVEQSGNGLVCITSPELKSLFVADETLDGALEAVPSLVRALIREEGRGSLPGEDAAE
ncbi:hypothetical protein OPKNFCMD_4806 [Methylobacterium crusticola]|uniref:AbrB/MazE/SpoVT family DNA-binding domain-containing protein n=1 Tax=Methylobacterium crusticola TaxID=1697972 RepID=A0ABQ4R4I1_9HYPH|nr:hypothetical protein [Methylobacterium crusticola]GJD52044.1 hypothetical protein OPKNFCMD_4806 [Methylobacterium crusticola]